MTRESVKKSRTKIIVIKEPLVAMQNEQEQDLEEAFSEEAIQEYINLQEKCEEIILRIKNRKKQQQNL